MSRTLSNDFRERVIGVVVEQAFKASRPGAPRGGHFDGGALASRLA